MTRTVPCPRCGELAFWDASNPARPFCSDRCKQIDLGHWAAESYRIPALVPPSMDEIEPPDTASMEPVRIKSM